MHVPSFAVPHLCYRGLQRGWNYQKHFLSAFCLWMTSLVGNQAQNLPPSDEAVQTTADEATISKISSAALGYYNDPYLAHLVRGFHKTRRAPLINRGYYTRVAGVRHALHAFIEGNTTSEKLPNREFGVRIRQSCILFDGAARMERVQSHYFRDRFS